MRPRAAALAHMAGAMSRRLAMLAALSSHGMPHGWEILLALGSGLVAGRAAPLASRPWLPAMSAAPGVAGILFALVAAFPGWPCSPPIHLFLLAFGCEMATAGFDPRRKAITWESGMAFGPIAARSFVIELLLGIVMVMAGAEPPPGQAWRDWWPFCLTVLSLACDILGGMVPAPPQGEPAEALPWPDADESRPVVWAAMAGGMAIASRAALGHADPTCWSWPSAWPLASGLVCGALLPATFSSPPRQDGWFPIAGIIGLAGFAILGAVGHLCWGSLLVFSMAVGMATGAARSTAMPRLKVLAAPRLLRLGGPFVIAAAIIGLVEPLPKPWPIIIASASLAMATLGAAWFLRRSFIELVIEIGLTPVYRISTAGPGQSRLPEGEPVLLIANHTAYADPFWLGAALRRRFYPMMTSTFYDLPVISFLMRDVVGAIRVPAISRRKDAPELLEAARLLEQSKCVLVFPEGTLRKCPEPVMRRFGRGIVKLLAEHPRTWVVPVWIEGAWGSYFSEAGGRPMTGKPMDFWRPIRIGIGEPRRIDPALLENHLKARAALQQAVYDCRGILGLDVPLAPAVFENQAEDPA